MVALVPAMAGETYAAALAYRASRVVVVEPPTLPWLTVEEVEAYRRAGLDEVPNLEPLIVEAAARVENDTGRALISRTLDVYLDAFPWGRAPVLVRQPPLQRVVSVTTVARDGTPTVVEVTDEDGDPTAQTTYLVDPTSAPGRLVLFDEHEAWPRDLRRINGVVIRIVAGYGAAADVPGPLKLAMQVLIGNAWEHREKTMVSQFAGQFIELPDYWQRIRPYQVVV